MPRTSRISPHAGVEDRFDAWIPGRLAWVAVEDTYDRWATASRPDRAPAFATYRAALDREQGRAVRLAGELVLA